jgi:hypothetical protein
MEAGCESLSEEKPTMNERKRQTRLTKRPGQGVDASELFASESTFDLS